MSPSPTKGKSRKKRSAERQPRFTNLADAVALARERLSVGEDPLARWILDTFDLALARHNAHDLPDVMGWGHDIVEIDENMTGSWDANDALGIATVIIVRAEDARDEYLRDIMSGSDE